MSAVRTAVSPPALTCRVGLRRVEAAARPLRHASSRRRPPEPPAGPGLAVVLLAAAGVAGFAVLCLPALRVQVAIGWLPLWLVAFPLAAWAALSLAGAWRANCDTSATPEAAAAAGPSARRERRRGVQAVRRPYANAGRPAWPKAA